MTIDPTPTAKDMLHTPAIGLDAAKIAINEAAMVEESGGVLIYMCKLLAVDGVPDNDAEVSIETCWSPDPSLSLNCEKVLAWFPPDDAVWTEFSSDMSTFDNLN